MASSRLAVPRAVPKDASQLDANQTAIQQLQPFLGERGTVRVADQGLATTLVEAADVLAATRSLDGGAQ